MIVYDWMFIKYVDRSIIDFYFWKHNFFFMSFSEYFNSNIKSEWRFYYVDYDKLREQIKPKSYSSKELEELNEAKFIEEVESELQKV